MMRVVKAYLNNYQMGSYTHSVLSQCIVNEERLNKSHTLVTWQLENEFQYQLLNRLLGEKLIEVK